MFLWFLVIFSKVLISLSRLCSDSLSVCTTYSEGRSVFSQSGRGTGGATSRKAFVPSLLSVGASCSPGIHRAPGTQACLSNPGSYIHYTCLRHLHHHATVPRSLCHCPAPFTAPCNNYFQMEIDTILLHAIPILSSNTFLTLFWIKVFFCKQIPCAFHGDSSQSRACRGFSFSFSRL